MVSKKALSKHPLAETLSFTDDDIRWATPQIVAKYRAERLKCKVIADIGCGIGFQTFAFAETCGKVYAIDIDVEKIERAKKNAAALGLKNIVFICGDALDPDVMKKLEGVEVVFCDPERLPQEAERTVQTIQPNIQKLIQMYSKITPKIAIEFPPQIQEHLTGCEREYISVDGTLNRLTLYFGSLKKTVRSAVILPEGTRLEQNPDAKQKKSGKLLRYLYEVNAAVVKAGLLSELCAESGMSLFAEGKSTFCTSDSCSKSPFFKTVFEVLAAVPARDKEVREALKKVGAGKVILRIPIDPDLYWKERKKWEQGLKGEKTVHLFQFGEKMVVGEVVSV